VFGIPNGRWEFAVAGTTAVDAGVAVPLGHHEAMILAAAEFDRMTGAVAAGSSPPGTGLMATKVPF
jgi:hypothetical protein